MVISPFLTNDRTKQLLSQGHDNILISRGNSLDDLTTKTLTQLQTNTTLYTLNEMAERPEAIEAETTLPTPVTDDLSGLHAKLYVAEMGWEATVLTGSANVSDAAFLGRNIEFMVELKGKRSQVGIEALLGDSAAPTSLRNLLQFYQPGPAVDESLRQIHQQMETALNHARQALIEASLRLTITTTPPDIFALALAADKPLVFDDDSVTGRCFPISRRREQAQAIAPLRMKEAVVFNNVSLAGLTSFMAFELTANLGQQQSTVSFVLNLPLIGLPPERDQAILRSIITDKNRFIRYLLFLLAEDKEFSLTHLLDNGNERQNGSDSAGYLAGLPLLEELIRTASRQPQKLERIAAVVDSLRRGDNDPLPEGFNDIWDAFVAYQRQGAEK